MNKYSKIVLVGGTGQIGKALINYFQDKSELIYIFSRKIQTSNEKLLFYQWNGEKLTDFVSIFENADIIINLVGKNVNCRYNQKNRNEIITSRINSINAIEEVVQLCNIKPRHWIQAASATIYQQSFDKEMTEQDEIYGHNFSENVCKTWENAFFESTTKFKEIKKTLLRTSIVLSKDNGAFPRLKKLVNYGLGGKQGCGNQMVSWIHEEDLCRSIEFIYDNQSEGIFNITATYPIKNTCFMSELRKEIKPFFFLPSPQFILKIGAFLISTEVELVLKSRFVIPDKLIKMGFEFKYPTIDKAIQNLLRNRINLL
ncbi:MAG: TIGR01777 family protein [Flavobacteriia bacterium]|nr:TIGR01777 family protein [Flavobacteriia bacterium]